MRTEANDNPDFSENKLDSICNQLTDVLDGISTFQRWMFPVHSAQTAVDALKSVGADVTLRVIGDLSHTYPREENNRILTWFTPDLALPV